MLLHLPESELITGVPVPSFLHVNEDRTWVCVNCWGNRLTFVWKTGWGHHRVSTLNSPDTVHSPPIQEDLTELHPKVFAFFQASLFVPRASRWLTAVSVYVYCYCASIILFSYETQVSYKWILKTKRVHMSKTNILKTRRSYFFYISQWVKEHRETNNREAGKYTTRGRCYCWERILRALNNWICWYKSQISSLLDLREGLLP